MSGLFKQTNSKIPAMAGGVSLQTSVYGKPIAIIYGTTRVSGNMLLYGNFQAVLVNQGQGSGSGGGGKGGMFGSNSNAGQQQWNYYAAFAFSLCEGPIQGIGTVWQDKSQYTLAALGFTLFTGTYPQTAWGTTVSWSYTNALGTIISGTAAPLGYNGFAYVADPKFNLGNNTSVPNLQFEVQGILSNSVSGQGDADPSQVLSDFLTNSHYGLGFPSARIGSLTNWQSYCLATLLLVSPNYDTQRTGADMITELATATNTAPVWSSGQLTMVPYGDAIVSSSVATFTPNFTPVYALGDNDFLSKPQSAGSLGGASGPVVLHRKRPSDKINSIKIEFLDRANNYAPSIAYANDQDLIDRYGIRSNGSQALHLLCNATAANLSAQLQLRRAARIANTYMFDLDARYVLLDPMDVISITDSGLGLSNQLVRITGIQENDDGTFSFTAEEILQNTGSAPLYNFGATLPYNSNPATATGSVNTPTIFEPPQTLFAQGGKPEIWMAASATDPLWGGANVWLSLDNSNYSLVGQIIGPSRQGTLTAAFSIYTGNSNPDTGNTCSVDLTESLGTLISGSALDASLGHTLCLVDSELFSYQTATLTAANKYNLTTLYRGLYGTGIAGHSNGAQFTRLDNAIFKYQLPPQYINQTIFIKLQSFNLYGSGLQSLASCTVYEFIPGGLGMVHPLSQALQVGLNQDLGSVTSAVAVFEDYGFLVGQASGATTYYFPQAVDMRALSSLFSVQFVQSLTNYMEYSVAQTTVSGGGSNLFPVQNSAKFAVSMWIKRTATGDQEMLFGGFVSSLNWAALYLTTANFVAWSWVVGGSTLSGVVSTVAISDASSTAAWHNVMFGTGLGPGTSTGTLPGLALIIDGTTTSTSQMTETYSTLNGFFPFFVWSTSASTGYAGGFISVPNNQGGLFASSSGAQNLTPIITLGGPASSISAVSGMQYFSGKMAEFYYLDGYGVSTLNGSTEGSILTSTNFASGTPGTPLQYTGFFGVIDAYLPFQIALSLGRDQSGEHNSYTPLPSSNWTSTNQIRTDYP